MKGQKKGELTFLASIACIEEDHSAIEYLPPIIETVLEENKAVMPDELPNTLPLRRKVDHKIEL